MMFYSKHTFLLSFVRGYNNVSNLVFLLCHGQKKKEIESKRQRICHLVSCPQPQVLGDIDSCKETFVLSFAPFSFSK